VCVCGRFQLTTYFITFIYFFLVYSRIVCLIVCYVIYGGQEFCSVIINTFTFSNKYRKYSHVMIQHYLHSVESNILLFWYMLCSLRRQWSIIEANLKNTIFLDRQPHKMILVDRNQMRYGN